MQRVEWFLQYTVLQPMSGMSSQANVRQGISIKKFQLRMNIQPRNCYDILLKPMGLQLMNTCLKICVLYSLSQNDKIG